MPNEEPNDDFLAAHIQELDRCRRQAIEAGGDIKRHLGQNLYPLLINKAKYDQNFVDFVDDLAERVSMTEESSLTADDGARFLAFLEKSKEGASLLGPEYLKECEALIELVQEITGESDEDEEGE